MCIMSFKLHDFNPTTSTLDVGGIFLFVHCRWKNTCNFDNGLSWENVIFEQFLHGPRKFSYRELSIATNASSPKELLGRGGFGCVYKGTLRDTNALVAVKKISKDSEQGGNEFLAELSIISRIQHRNLVNLQGWCSERGELMLVYDYMPNKSLDKLLFQNCSELAVVDHHQNSTAMKLDRGMRHNILLGVASALAYLHEDWSEHRVVHRDVKASNVMLDKDFNACLGDFGLARLIEHSKEDADTTIVAGTVRYLAPELARTGKPTTMSDVFSYGALALEVACGRRPFDRKFPEEQIFLLDWVWNCYENGELLEVVVSKLGNNFSEEQMTKVLLLGLFCSHPDPNARPPMGYVRQVLVGNASLPPLPLAKPTYISQETCSLNMANSDCFSLKYGDLGPFSFPGKSLHMSCMAHFIVYGAKIRYKKNLSLTMEGI
ncbi:unnamed protein product, partial [Sphagnum troendelagicum]